MPRDLFRRYIADVTRSKKDIIRGEIISGFYNLEFDPAGTTMLVADVRVGAEIINRVPASEMNKELRDILPGTPVTMRKSETGRLEIIGVEKRGFGTVSKFLITIPKTVATQTSQGIHSTNAGFAVVGGGETARFITAGVKLTSAVYSGVIVSQISTSGFVYRSILLDELETISGFGFTLLESFGLFDLDGNFLRYI